MMNRTKVELAFYYFRLQIDDLVVLIAQLRLRMFSPDTSK